MNQRPAYLDLAPGDPWSFLYPVENAERTGKYGRKVEPGEFVTKWFDTSEPGRVFRVTAVHESSVETVYVGFAVPTPAEVTP